MARIYYGSCASYNGNIYLVEIWDAPSGSAVGGTELVLHGNGVEFQYQGEGNKLYENTILPSRATAIFNIDNETAFNFFTALGVENEGQYAMVIYKDSALWWVGRIIADQNEYDKSAIEANLGFKVTSVDTLNLLKDFYVNPSWFGSSKRLNIIAFIKQCLSLTGLSQYWTHIAPTSPFLIDAYQKGDITPFDQYLVYLELNLISVIKDYAPFYDQENDDADAEIWIDCKTAIENILSAFKCQIRLSGGAFWIWSIYDIGDWTDINYVSYNIALGVVSLYGRLGHSVTIGTGVQRNRFEKYATFGFQPPLREIQANYEKLSMVRTVRTFAHQDGTVLEAGPLEAVDTGTSATRSDITAKATLSWGMMTTAASVLKSHTLTYRYYCYNSTTGAFKIYNPNTQVWDISATIPDWQEVELDIANVETVNGVVSIVTVDFYKRIPAPNAGDNVYLQLLPYNSLVVQFTGVLNYPYFLYNFSGNNTVNFWGNASLIQKERKPSMTKTTNTNSTTASEIYEYDRMYHNKSGWIGSSSRSGFYNTNTNAMANAGRGDGVIMALYNKAVKTLAGTWHDSGTYQPVKTILIGTDLYAFNGGTYSVRSDKWDGEWLLIDKYFTPVVEGDEQELDDTDDNTKEAVERLFEQLDTTRESVSNIPKTLPYLISGLAVNMNDTAPPTENTYIGVQMFFNADTQLLDWTFAEQGKSVTFTAGESDVEGRPDIILADTTAGAIILNLPLAADAKGIPYVIKKIGIPHSVTINGVDIDGSSNYIISDLNDVVTIKSNGSYYYVVGAYATGGGGSDPNKQDKFLVYNEQTGSSYTLQLSDDAIEVQRNNAGANTTTIPPNSSVAIPVGSQRLLTQTGVGSSSIVAGLGVTILSYNSALTLAGRYVTITMRKVAINTWIINGQLI